MALLLALILAGEISTLRWCGALGAVAAPRFQHAPARPAAQQPRIDIRAPPRDL